MLFDSVLQIIVHRSAGHDARLAASVHRQLIEVIAGLFVLHKVPVRHHAPEQLLRLFIDAAVVEIHILRELRLRAVDA